MSTPLSRRRFLGHTVMTGALAQTVPAFLASTWGQLHAQAEGHPAQAGNAKDGPILVVLQLAGGNDGLNTVVPFANDDYHRARPQLSLKSDKVLHLNDTTGFHPALAGLKDLHDSGWLGIIPGVGYPNPNRSHFRSTDIWMTASASDRVESHGWLGRYFDHACSGADPTVGLAVGRQTPLAFAAEHPTGVALENPESLHYIEGKLEKSADGGTERYYRQMGHADEMAMEPGTSMSGDTIGSAAGAAVYRPSSPIDFLERTASHAQSSADLIQKVAARAKNQATYPASRLANDLRWVARMIAGGLSTQVYYVSHGGFDTHANQLPTHQRLLSELGDATRAFLQDLKAMGQLDRVLLMTFSEFGRRVAENASGGTDHGAAAPMFVAGGKVHAGLHGPFPSLAPADLLNGDIRFQTDFRSVYGTILEKWLHTAAKPVLGSEFPTLNLI